MHFGGFPFGGMDDAFMGGPPRRSREVDNKKLYEVLGVKQEASVHEIRKAYKKLAMQHHPDKGGDENKFKEISKAYDVLNDPEKRRKYDEYGEEGLEGGAGEGPTDIFDMFFPGRSRGGTTEKKKGENVVSELKCTLEQLYNGCTRKLAINKDIVCPICNGLKGPKEAIEVCQTCNGRGMRTRITQIGPIVQQTSSACNECMGKGKFIPQEKRCRHCKGEGTVKERKVLEVYIDKGAPHGHKITFRGEADEKPDEIPGDVVFVLSVADHPKFQRKNADLYMEKEISLYEALTGFQFHLEHLDGRKLLIKSPLHEVTKPDDIKAVEDEGMPVFKSPFTKGHLFIKFKVVFPTYEELHAKCGPKKEPSVALLSVLPAPASVSSRSGSRDEDEDVEVHEVKDIDPTESQRNHHNREVYEEDDEDSGHGARRVQCAQQ